MSDSQVNNIRTCFMLYVNHLRSQRKDLVTEAYNYETLTDQQIRSQLDILHMKYILSSSFTLNDSSPCMVAYKHLKSMIDGNSIDEKCSRLQFQISKVETENRELKHEIQEVKQKVSTNMFNNYETKSPQSSQTVTSKGWF